jgi:hypothetical protein
MVKFKIFVHQFGHACNLYQQTWKFFQSVYIYSALQEDQQNGTLDNKRCNDDDKMADVYISKWQV